MSEKKNIDRLFQEKFKDFEAAPPEQLWHNIEAELQKDKKKRRVIPLWFRLSGVAAILVLGLMLTIPLFKTVDTGTTPVVLDDTDGQGREPIKKITPVDKPIRPSQTVTEIGDETIVLNPGDAVASGNGSGNANGTLGTNKSSGITTTPGTGGAAIKRDAVAYGTGQGYYQQQINSGNPGTANRTGKAEANQSHTRNRNTNYGVINTSNNNAIADKAKSGGKLNTGLKQEKPIAQNTINGSAKQNQTNAIQNNGSANAGNITVLPQENTAVANTNANKENTAGTVIDKAAAETAIAEAAVDTVKPQNELEKLLQDKLNGEKDKEEKAVAETDKNKWNIKPQLAPVFYNSLSNGSPIDAQFAGNSKDYDNDLSYGVAVNYAVSNRISVRTGVNTVNLNYTTNDIQFYAALNHQTPNVAARGTIANIVVQNGGTNPGSTFADQLPTKTFNGSLVQKTGYIEVPLEMSYKLLDKRFGIDIIGGVSTLFLNQNDVSVRSSQGLVSEMGEAQNLNNIHFSTNIGVGFKYRFWKAFEANFEPMFKYQVNTFSSNAGNFKPYFIGLYSGISFSF